MEYQRGSIIFIYCSIMLQFTDAAKFLLLPYSFGSHIAQQVVIAKELMKNGHEIHLVLSQSFPEKSKWEGQGITIHTHHTPDKDLYMLGDEDIAGVWDSWIGRPAIYDMTPGLPLDVAACTNMLSDDKLYHKLKKLKFDMAILDSFPNGRCFGILLYRLGVPFVTEATVFEPWLLRNPSFPSYVPLNFLAPTTSEMSFWERFDNLRAQLQWFVAPGALYLDDDMVKRYAPEKPAITINKLIAEALLWLVDTDVAIDYPRPVMPNEVLTGGMATKPGKPLPGELEKFMSENPLGSIVVSFGSMGVNLPQEMMNKLLATFKRLKFNIIWRYPVDPPADLPKNIKLMSWMPQNDLLAHNNTKLFITHCGSGGQFEGLYHAVPMIGLPLFGDQPYNAKRMAYKGFGEELNIREFTADELEATIHKVIGNPSYQEAISSASALYRSRPMTALQRAVWWIEHVLKHGGRHYRSFALDMPWYQYLMLDIFAFVLAIFITSITLLKLCVSKLCGSKTKGKEKVN